MQSAQQLYTDRFDEMLDSIIPTHMKAARKEAQENTETSELIEQLLVDGEIEINGEMIYQADVIDTISQDPDFDRELIRLTLASESDKAHKLTVEAFEAEAAQQIETATKQAA
jgi:hypothetical protein